jgi:hypothetical protein
MAMEKCWVSRLMPLRNLELPRLKPAPQKA